MLNSIIYCIYVEYHMNAYEFEMCLNPCCCPCMVAYCIFANLCRSLFSCVAYIWHIFVGIDDTTVSALDNSTESSVDSCPLGFNRC